MQPRPHPQGMDDAPIRLQGLFTFHLHLLIDILAFIQAPEIEHDT
jgi:hypothetical protein